MITSQAHANYCIAELSLSYSYKVAANQRKFIKQSSDAYDFIKPYYQSFMELKEVAYAVFLNQANHIIGTYKISEGGIMATIIDLKLLFVAALKSLAQQIIVFHNHPSGNLSPSKHDTAMTNRIIEAGKLLDIKVIDHIIVSSDGFYSFSDNGEMI